ncbi:hypothetical protein Tco_1105897 [Tanacetum coccineum]
MEGSGNDNPPPTPPPPTTPQTAPQQAPHTVSTIKLPILKKGEYDIWAIKMEHYLAHTDYPIWEVIQKGNGPVSVTTDTDGVIRVLPPRTAEETLARERERKARTILLMALPEDHLAKFHKMTDAKDMWEAIKSRFGGNDEYKKMQDEPKAMVTVDGESVDWTAHAEDKQEDFAFMAYGNSSSDSELWYEEKIKFMKIDLDDKTNVLAYHKKLLAEALKEKDELKTKVENWHSSSKNLGRLLNTQMSVYDKFGLGYEDHIYDGILSYENEVLQSVFMNKESELVKQPLYDRFVTSDGMHAVPPPMIGNYMPSGPDVELDDSNVESLECLPKQVVKEPKVACKPKVWTDAPIIEEYESDSNDDCVPIPLKEIEQPSFGVDSDKQVKTSRENVKDKHTHSADMYSSTASNQISTENVRPVVTIVLASKLRCLVLIKRSVLLDIYAASALYVELPCRPKKVLNAPDLWIVVLRIGKLQGIGEFSVQTTSGKEFSNPLIADSLLKTIWFSTHHTSQLRVG